MNAGEAIVEFLRQEKVSHIFGLLGSSTMEVYDALYEHESLKYIGVRDERSGVHMADAVGRVTGRPGVFLAGQAGPGAANMVTGLAQAKLAYSPVVAITGLVSSDHFGRDAFQEIDQQALFAPITKRTMSVPRADRIPEFLSEAFRVANSGRRGPVVVQIPRDFFSAEVEMPKATDALSAPIAGAVDAEQVAAVCKMLRSAKAPVIIAGGGVLWGRGDSALAALTERLSIPVTASAGHPDVLANDHPMYFGQVGPRGNRVASQFTRDADLIIALGTRLGFNTTFYGYNDLSPNAKIVQVDVHAEAVGRHFPVAAGIVGDAGTVAEAIDKGLPDLDGASVPWRPRVEDAITEREALWREREEAGASTRQPLAAERVFKELRDTIPRDAVITLDAGTLCLQATDQLRYYKPPALLTPLDFGLVGFSYAAGLGAKAALPDRPVVTLMGDGGFAMNMSEITTAVAHGLSSVAVVLDNGCWGAEKAYQRDFYNGRYIGSDLINPAYDKVAEASGAKGYAVSAPGELSDALRDALGSGEPAVIHVQVDPNAMVSFRRDAFTHRSSS